MKVLILGGTGVISRAIVDQLLLKNHEVAIFNRGSRNLPFKGDVRQIIGNRADRQTFEAEMQREKFDVVIDMICFNEADARSTVNAFKGNVEQLVVCSSVAVYKRPYKSLPIQEDKEALWDDPAFGYAFEKAQVERYLNQVIAEGDMNITIVRPSLTFGPGAANIGVLRQNYGIVDRIRKGKPLIMFGDGTNPWSFTFAPDLAKGFAGVVGNKSTYGRSYHITNEERTRWDDLYLTIGKIIGKQPDIRHISTEQLYKYDPAMFGHLYFEKSYPGIFDNSKIKGDVPGFKAEITLEEGMRTILEWFEKEANTVDPVKDALEDKLIGLSESWIQQI